MKVFKLIYCLKRKKIIIKKDRISSVNIENLAMGKKIYNIFHNKKQRWRRNSIIWFEIKNISELTRVIGKKLPLSK